MDQGDGALSPETRALHAELLELRRMVQGVRQEVTCGSCRSIMQAPVALPCGHTFCSECARRSLLLRARCLEAHCRYPKKIVTAKELVPVRSLEAVALSFYSTNNNISKAKTGKEDKMRDYLPYLPDKNKRLLLRHLKELRLNTDGTVDELAERYRDFVLRWNANLDKAAPLPESKIVDAVTKAERERRNAQVKKKSNMFRRKIAESPSQISQGANSSSNSPQEGDDFDTLIEKLRRRENRTINRTRDNNNTGDGDNNGSSHNARDMARNDSGVEAAQGNDVMRTGSPTESDLAFMECSSQPAIVASQNSQQPMEETRNDSGIDIEAAQENDAVRTRSPTESDLAFMECSSQAAIVASQNSQQPMEETEESEAYKSCNTTGDTTPERRTNTTILQPRDDTQSTVAPPTPNRNTAANSIPPARNENTTLFEQITQVPPSYGAGTITIGPRRTSQRRNAPPPQVRNQSTPTRNIAPPNEAPVAPNRNTGQAANAAPPARNLATPDRNARQAAGFGTSARNGNSNGNGHSAITINIMPPNNSNEAPMNNTPIGTPQRSARAFNGHSPNRNGGDIHIAPAVPPVASSQPSISINILTQNDDTIHTTNNSVHPRLTPQRRPWTAPSPAIVSPPRNTPQRPWTSPTSATSPPGPVTTQQELPAHVRERIERNKRRAIELQLAKRRRIQQEQQQNGAVRR